MGRYECRDRVIVVTGGASGIGLAVCRAAAARGAIIGMLDIDSEGLRIRREEFLAHGFDILTLRCDVASETDCRTAVRSVIGRYGRVDILFNNAGITQRGSFEQTEISVFRQVMDVNFYGALYCTKAALPSLLENRGVIVVNESVAGVAPLLGRAGYSASKHALHGLFTSLRCEIGHAGVHVMIVCPGFIRTDLQTRALGHDGRIATEPQSRVGREYSAEHAARRIVEALERRKPMVVLTPAGKIGYLLSRLSPMTYERLMARQLKNGRD